jgi:hypothetical protein
MDRRKSDDFIDLIDEIGEKRASLLEDIIFLIENDNLDQIRSYLGDPDVLRFLLDGEIEYLDEYCMKFPNLKPLLN